MSASYKKLRKLLIDKDMRKKTCMKGGYQPSICHQDGVERTCHHRDTREDLCDARAPRRRIHPPVSAISTTKNTAAKCCCS